MVHLQSGAATDVGRVREVNEDSYLASPPVFVVADGMGGHHGGDVASGIVVEEFARLAHHGYDSTRGTEVVTECLAASQRRIREYGDAHRAEGEPDWYSGTTVVAALLCEDEEGPKWLLANLGDSRIYRLHEGTLDQVSVDHSVVQELMDAGKIDAHTAAATIRSAASRGSGAGARISSISWSSIIPLTPSEQSTTLLADSSGSRKKSGSRGSGPPSARVITCRAGWCAAVWASILPASMSSCTTEWSTLTWSRAPSCSR